MGTMKRRSNRILIRIKSSAATHSYIREFAGTGRAKLKAWWFPQTCGSLPFEGAEIRRLER